MNNTTADFSSVNDLTNATVTINGASGSADLSTVTQIDGASLFVTGGATLSLPAVVSYSNSIDDTWRAEGAGSTLSLPNLTSITNGNGLDHDFTIQAQSGGQVELPQVVSITDPNTGDTRNRGVFVTADGEESFIDLSSLQFFFDANSNQRSTLTASDFGQISVSPEGVATQVVDVTVSENSTIEGSLFLNSESRLFGQGTISGNLTNASEFTPGRTFSIGGSYIQQIGGTLSVDVAGTDAGAFDVITVGGSASFSGELNVVLEGGFIPAASNPALPIIAFASQSGTFSTINNAGYNLAFSPRDISLVFPAAAQSATGQLATVSLATTSVPGELQSLKASETYPYAAEPPAATQDLELDELVLDSIFADSNELENVFDGVL